MAAVVADASPPAPSESEGAGPTQSENWTLADDLEQVRAIIGKSTADSRGEALRCCSQELVHCVFTANRYRKVNLRLHLKGYPEQRSPIVEMDSAYIRPGVVKKLTKAVEARIADAAKAGDMQILAAVTFLRKTVMENRLLCCMDEVRKEQKAMGNTCSKLVTKDDSGLIRFSLANGAYKLTLELRIPDGYPAGQVSVTLRKSNFPKSVLHVYQAQADEIARRCALGYSEEQAIRGSSGLERPPEKKSSVKKAVRLDAKKVNQLKNDVRVLKKVNDLSGAKEMSKQKRLQFTQSGNRRGLREGYESARRARRELRQLVKTEGDKEAKWAAEEQREAASAGALGASDSTRSVAPIIRFIARRVVKKLPQETCQGCKARLLPDDPATAADVFKSANKKRARRVYCGHWWHHNCLSKVLKKPPFGMQGCPSCGPDVRIWHHDWGRDIKKLEKHWAAERAREREIESVAKVFNLGDEFLV